MTIRRNGLRVSPSILRKKLIHSTPPLLKTYCPPAMKTSERLTLVPAVRARASSFLHMNQCRDKILYFSAMKLQ